jgi:hypothetical protein
MSKLIWSLGEISAATRSRKRKNECGLTQE